MVLTHFTLSGCHGGMEGAERMDAKDSADDC